MKNTFIHQLPTKVQKQVEKELRKVLFTSEDIENALDSRLSDLADTIDLSKIKLG